MTTYRFRFDARGMKVEDPAQVAAKGLAASVADGTLTAAPPDPAVVVNELGHWLDMHPDFGLDLRLLEEREVLLTPPSWISVTRFAASLLGKEVAEPGTEEDRRQAVEKYVEMLGSREQVLNYALALAAYASLASTATDPAAQTQDALRALPKGAKMDPASSVSIPALPTLPSLLAEGKAREWIEAAHARHNLILKSTPVPDLDLIEAESWKTWQKRLSEFRRSRRSFAMNREDLLLRTRSAGPARLFWNELAQMPLSKWTEALLTASRNTDVPPWVRREVEAELVTGRNTVLIIVGDSESSPTAAWLPSRKAGSLWVARARWQEAFDALPANALIAAGTLILAIEVGGDPDAVTKLIGHHPGAVLGRTPAPLPYAVYLGKDKLPPQATPSVPYIEGAKDVDDVITKVAAVTRLA